MGNLDLWVSAPAGVVTAVVAGWLALSLLTAGALRVSDRRAAGRARSVLDGLLRTLAPGLAGRALRAAVGLGATGTTLLAGAALPAAAAPAATPAAVRTATGVATPAGSTTGHGQQGSRRAASPVADEGRPAGVRTPPPDLWPLSPRAGRRDAEGDRDVVVHRGDTLWAIAARHLPATATNADISAAWRSWFGANRAVIGSDPNYLLAGQVLHAPR